VRNIAADCAAIIPKSMEIAFVGAEGATNAAEIYQSRADWLNRELSKAIVGQTSTSEGQQGSHAIGRVHRQVQDDIARHDCLVISATLSHTIVKWIVDLNFGPQTRHPWLHLGEAPAADLTQLAGSLAALVPLGLDVATDDVRDRFGFAKPDAGAPVLKAPPGAPPLDLPPAAGSGDGQSGLSALLSAEPQPTGPERLTTALIRLSRVTERAWLDEAAALLDASRDLDEFADRLPELLARLGSARLAGQVGDALTAAHVGGMADVADEVRDG
jgi:phage gp29-like protein